MSKSEQLRRESLQAVGASDTEVNELLVYLENRFDIPTIFPTFPLSEEIFAKTWRQYSHVTATQGTLNALRFQLVQLLFPVESGISGDVAYQAATKRGLLPSTPVCGGAMLRHPETCRIQMHESFAGAIGVLTAEDRNDFETLVRVFTKKNEPVPIPLSMGATMVSGYNNWHRVELLKTEFLEAGGEEQNWSVEFQQMKQRPHLYQDRFFILSQGPYSGVSAQQMGLNDSEWRQASWMIRLGHEYAHYFTKRFLGRMQNNLLDELLADYAGLRQAFGSFSARSILLFLGLEEFLRYREGGRLQNYRGSPTLGEGAFRVLMTLVWNAVHSLEVFDLLVGQTCVIPAALLAIASMTIDELAHPDSAKSLMQLYQANLSGANQLSMSAQSVA